jgi:polar amino acid transport system substrate-binding protein
LEIAALLLRVIICICLFVLSVGSHAQTLKFCYEDKELAPSYMGRGLIVPTESPGVVIEILRMAEQKFESLTIEYIRQPWQRCLHDMKRNKVDAVVASFREYRTEFLTFPMGTEGEVDKTLAMNEFGRCYVGDKNFIRDLEDPSKILNLAVPNGYSSAKSVDESKFAKVATPSQLDAFELVNKRVVDGAIGLCMINGFPIKAFPYSTKLHAKYPPFDKSYGYLAFSKLFYANNPQLAKQLWQEMIKFPYTEVYMRYLEVDNKDINSDDAKRPEAKQ